MREEMTVTEIMNFAQNFCNLINMKNSEIAEVKAENRRLSAMVHSLQRAGEVLAVEDIYNAQRGVWIEQLGKYRRPGRYALPLKDRTGVLTAEKGICRYDQYGKTWVAYAERPQKIEEGQV